MADTNKIASLGGCHTLQGDLVHGDQVGRQSATAPSLIFSVHHPALRVMQLGTGLSDSLRHVVAFLAVIRGGGHGALQAHTGHTHLSAC